MPTICQVVVLQCIDQSTRFSKVTASSVARICLLSLAAFCVASTAQVAPPTSPADLMRQFDVYEQYRRSRDALLRIEPQSTAPSSTPHVPSDSDRRGGILPPNEQSSDDSK